MTDQTRYAAKTTVPVEKTKAEIESLLRKHGADQVMTAWESSRALVAFRVNGLSARIDLPLPDRDQFLYTERKTAHSTKQVQRTLPQQQTAYDQAERQAWRALLLVTKAKLEAVAAGISTMEQEFLAHILMPSNDTVGETLLPRLHEYLDTGELPQILPAQRSRAIPLPPAPAP